MARFSIRSLELFVREMPPDRMPFSVGRDLSAKSRRPRAVFLVRLKLGHGKGKSETVVGRSGDRPSFGWLDKRKDRSPEAKLTDLIELVKAAREIYLENGNGFDTPFALWHSCHGAIMRQAQDAGQEPLTASYASALFERAVIDAVCRAEGMSFFRAVHRNRLGIEPGRIHPELSGVELAPILPPRQRARFAIRHTVGNADPLTGNDLERRLGDGEPETLLDYVQRHELRYFKVKISGDSSADLARLARIWNEVLIQVHEPAVTLDGNEAYTDIAAFREFVAAFESELTGLFQHTLFIEQPLTRALTQDPETAGTIRELSDRKPLVIDEADGTLDSFKKAFAIGYSGVSHKNCKGVFKSLLNHALADHFSETTGRDAFLSGEDLSNMAIVPLHQDFDALSVLGIGHCERNGHHYAYGMSHLTEEEKAGVVARHGDLYRQGDDEVFLNIREGKVSCGSIFGPGFGGATGPDWASLTPLDQWNPA